MIVSAHFSAVEIHFFQLVSSASSRSFTHTYALKSHTTLWTPNVIQQFSLKHRFIFVLKMRMTILQTQNWHFFFIILNRWSYLCTHFELHWMGQNIRDIIKEWLRSSHDHCMLASAKANKIECNERSMNSNRI